MMNKIIYVLFAILLWQLPSEAQVTQREVEQRAIVTRIADLLTGLPASNAQKLEEHMQKLNRFSVPSITALVGRLQPPGQGKNAKIKYALNSYAFYVRQSGKEDMRMKFIKGLIPGLDDLQHKENKGFIISLLQIAGTDEAIPALTPYLEDNSLSGKAARALVTIGSGAAAKALLGKVETLEEEALVPIVEALGDLKYAPAEPALLVLHPTGNRDLKKVIHYALSNIAGTSSYKTLRKAARNSEYTFDETNAVSAYIQYASNLLSNGEERLSKKIGKELLEKSKDDNQLHSRIKGLWLLTELQGTANTRELIKAATDQNLEYRSAALEIAAPYMNAENQGEWERAFKKADPEIRASLIPFFLKHWRTEDLMPILTESLRSVSALERAAAIKALASNQGVKSVPALLHVLSKGEVSDRDAIQEAFLTMKGEALPEQLTAALWHATADNQVMLLNVLERRAYGPAFSVVYALLDTKNDEVRKAAYRALTTVSRSENLPQLLQRLHNPVTAERSAVHEAIVDVIQFSDTKAQDIASFLSYYRGLNEHQKVNTIPVLSGIGGVAALDAASETLNSDSPVLWDESVQSIANWRDASALEDLIRFSKDNRYKKHADTIMSGIIRLTPLASISEERKVLIYRDAMDIARKQEQKIALLENLQETKTYNAYMYAGTFLKDPELQNTAAMTAMNIALDRPDFYGSEVRSILDEVFVIVNRRRYLGEGIEKHLAGLPKEAGYVSLFKDKLGRNGLLALQGEADAIQTGNEFGDFDMLLDWQIDTKDPNASASVILRGVPALDLVNGSEGAGDLGGSPGLVKSSAPGAWNSLRIQMRADKITLYVNGELLAKDVPLDTAGSIPGLGAVGLQPEGAAVNFRNIYLKEITRKEVFVLSEQEKAEGFKVLFDGTNLDSWIGNKESYVVSEEGTLAIFPKKGSGGNLYSKEEFSDFIYRLEFRLTARANNGIGMRAPLKGNASFLGMEVAILDDTHEVYKDLAPWQYNGSIYGVIPAKRGYLNPVGEWNVQEIYLKGNHIRVTLNGTVVLEGDLAEASKNGTVDGKDHPGLTVKKGHLAFLGHGSEVHFRRIRIKELKD